MNAGDSACDELDSFPGLTQETLDEIDSMFGVYLMYKREGRTTTVWCTACHREMTFRAGGRTETAEDRLWAAPTHGSAEQCPSCGRWATVGCIGRYRSGKKIEMYIPVLVLDASPDGGTVWAQGYWVKKDPANEPLGRPRYMVTSVYLFQPGRWKQWDRSLYGEGMIEARKSGRSWISEPFRESNSVYAAHSRYRVVGMKKLERSFLAYTGAETPVGEWDADRWRADGRRNELIRYLALAAQHPRQTEMMRKTGVTWPIEDWIYGKRKNARLIRWAEEDPKKAFGLSKGELRDYVRLCDTMKRGNAWMVRHTLELFKKGDGSLTMDDIAELLRRMGYVATEALGEAMDRARELGLRQKKLIRYLGEGREWGETIERLKIWLDYIHMACDLGWDLVNPLIQMPGDLLRKHDEASRAILATVDREAAEARDEAYRRRVRRYAFSMDGLQIVVPMSGAEIRAEGAALKHCVASYAERHMEGKLTILFLRRTDRPREPYVTIEMHGDKMVQIHGFQNDRGRESPNKTHKDFLAAWLAWVADGSRRNKDGSPRLPREQKGDAA